MRFGRTFAQKIGVLLFDSVKRLRMEATYRHGGTWGRNDNTADVEAAMALVSGRQYRRVLDIGTGIGHYAEIASGIARHVTAMDISSIAIRNARERLGGRCANIKWIVGNIRTFTAYGQFDLVICGDALYYLGDRRFPSEFATCVLRITKLVAPGGHMLFSNYISGPGRTAEESIAYIKLFEQSGLLVEREKMFTSVGKTWHQVLFIKT